MQTQTLPRLEKLLSEIDSITDRDTRLELLIELADRFQPTPEEIACRPYPEEQKVPGCESEVYGWATSSGPSLKFHFAVENPQGLSAMALAVIIDEALSEEPLEKIVQVPDEVINRIFGHTVSMGKGQGLTNMLRLVKRLAGERLRTRDPV